MKINELNVEQLTLVATKAINEQDANSALNLLIKKGNVHNVIFREILEKSKYGSVQKSIAKYFLSQENLSSFELKAILRSQADEPDMILAACELAKNPTENLDTFVDIFNTGNLESTRKIAFEAVMSIETLDINNCSWMYDNAHNEDYKNRLLNKIVDLATRDNDIRWLEYICLNSTKSAALNAFNIISKDKEYFDVRVVELYISNSKSEQVVLAAIELYPSIDMASAMYLNSVSPLAISESVSLKREQVLLSMKDTTNSMLSSLCWRSNCKEHIAKAFDILSKREDVKNHIYTQICLRTKDEDIAVAALNEIKKDEKEFLKFAPAICLSSETKSVSIEAINKLALVRPFEKEKITEICLKGKYEEVASIALRALIDNSADDTELIEIFNKTNHDLVRGEASMAILSKPDANKEVLNSLCMQSEYVLIRSAAIEKVIDPTWRYTYSLIK